jgi:predicted ATPase/DNA-binding SARP family transcriptional activator
MLKIYLFGNLRLSVDREPLRFAALPKTLPLWTYLLLNRYTAVPREHVAFVIWPDEDEPTARSNLRRHLHDLRRALPPAPDDAPWLLSQGDKLQWNPKAAYWLDVEEFQQSATDLTRLPEILKLYTGDLLPSLYDDWLFFDRERLRNDFFAAVEQLIRQSYLQQEYRQGVEYAMKLLNHDPLREDTLRDLMLLRYLSGDRTGALRDYKQFEQRLAEELDVAPMPETNELFRAIFQNEPSRELLPPELATQPDPVVASVAGAPESEQFSRPHNIPAALTSFIGRTEELERLSQLLRPSSPVRLLTLAGTVGSGKTRLALELARLLVDMPRGNFDDGIFFVPLGAVTDPQQVIPAIATTLAIAESGRRPLEEDVKGHLKSRQLLLILDNFEQVMPAAAQIADLLAAAPRLRVIVTSRSALHLYGEQGFSVQPLPLPASNQISLQEAATSPAMMLFVERAQAVNPAFSLNVQNIGAIAAICARLDGLPLAIELAAARSKLFSPTTLLARLSGQFDFLNSQVQQAPNRQQTLRSVVDWSYALLSPVEKALFAQLSVFSGFFTLDAVEAVVDRSRLVEPGSAVASPVELFTELSSLVDHHMLLATDPSALNGNLRFRMLLILREYAQDQMAARGEAEALRLRHAIYYAELAERAAQQFHGPQQLLWLQHLEGELDNLRNALTWTIEHAISDVALRLAAALGEFWQMRGHLHEGRQWLERVLESPQTPLYPLLRARALVAAGLLAQYRGDYIEAEKIHKESLALASPPEGGTFARRALYGLGFARLYQHHEEGRQILEQSISYSQQAGDRWGMAAAMHTLSNYAISMGEVERAREYLEESLSLYRSVGDTDCIALVLLSMANLAFNQDDYATAHTLYQRCVPIFQQFGDKHSLAFAWVNMASMELLHGNFAQAGDLAEKSLALFLEVDERWQPPRLIRMLAYVAIHQGDLKRATELCQESYSLNQALSDRRGMIACLVAFARIALEEGNVTGAARWLAAVEHYLAVYDLQLLATDAQTFEQVFTAVQGQIGSEQWEELHRQKPDRPVDTILGLHPEMWTLFGRSSDAQQLQ